jgi:hypothetical protein
MHAEGMIATTGWRFGVKQECRENGARSDNRAPFGFIDKRERPASKKKFYLDWLRLPAPMHTPARHVCGGQLQLPVVRGRRRWPRLAYFALSSGRGGEVSAPQRSAPASQVT